MCVSVCDVCVYVCVCNILTASSSKEHKENWVEEAEGDNQHILVKHS